MRVVNLHIRINFIFMLISLMVTMLSRIKTSEYDCYTVELLYCDAKKVRTIWKDGKIVVLYKHRRIFSGILIRNNLIGRYHEIGCLNFVRQEPFVTCIVLYRCEHINISCVNKILVFRKTICYTLRLFHVVESCLNNKNNNWLTNTHKKV